MEEISAIGLTQRKESVATLAPDVSPPRPGSSHWAGILDYPFAVVLRLRVLQIVCGISALVMGSVALIEERNEANLGLGVPAGSATILAAAASIHTTRGWSVGLGESRSRKSLALVLPCLLWTLACTLHAALLVQCTRTISSTSGKTFNSDELSASSWYSFEEDEEDPARPSARDLTVLAVVQIVLTVTTLACSAFCARIDCRDSPTNTATTNACVSCGRQNFIKGHVGHHRIWRRKLYRGYSRETRESSVASVNETGDTFFSVGALPLILAAGLWNEPPEQHKKFCQ